MAKSVKSSQRSFPLLAVLAAIVVVAVLVALAIGGDSGDPTVAEDPPIVGGEPLPALPDAGPDPAVGMTIPNVVGPDRTGETVNFTRNERAKVIVFVAHWCPHCQNELPVLVQALENGDVPEEIDLWLVSTGISPTRENYPPEDWFFREGWNGNTLVDTDSSVSEAYGLTAFPFWVLVDEDDQVIARASGEVGPDQLRDIFAQVAATTTT